MKTHEFMQRIFGSAVIVLLLSQAGIPAMAADEGPELIVTHFYTAYLAGGKSGLPGVDEMKRLSAFLSPGLVQLIENARAEQAAFMAEHPNEKPPLIEGDLFSSLFEGAVGFTVGTPEGGNEKVRVPIRFFYVDPGDSEAAVAWEDAVVLVRENDRWLIDDVLYLGEWAFKQGANLRGVLADDPD